MRAAPLHRKPISYELVGKGAHTTGKERGKARGKDLEFPGESEGAVCDSGRSKSLNRQESQGRKEVRGAMTTRNRWERKRRVEERTSSWLVVRRRGDVRLRKGKVLH